MKKFFFILLLYVVIAPISLGQHAFIYRNDASFNAISPAEGLTVSHNTSDNIVTFSTPDNDDISLPISVIDSCAIRISDIPHLHLTFPDYPEVSDVWTKDDYITANLDVVGNNMIDDVSAMTLKIKGRGNSSWYFPKKPMRLKFDKKISLCGLPKAKNFVLLANYLDNSHLRNALAFWLGQQLGLSFTNPYIPVNVSINGSNRGLYLLTPKIGINSASVDIEESTGILFELSTEFDEAYQFRSEINDMPVMVKDPDFDELYEDDEQGLSPQQRLELWQNDFNNAEALLNTQNATEAFDISSAAKAFLIFNLTGNNEVGYPKSFYLYKENLGSEFKYKFGPIWDFDVAYNLDTTETESVSPDKTLWCNSIFYGIIDLPEFRTEYETLVSYFTTEILPNMLKYIDHYSALIEPSAKLDGMVWSEEKSFGWTWRHSSFDTSLHVESLRDWLIARVEFIQKQIDKGLY